MLKSNKQRVAFYPRILEHLKIKLILSNLKIGIFFFVRQKRSKKTWGLRLSSVQNRSPFPPLATNSPFFTEKSPRFLLPLADARLLFPAPPNAFYESGCLEVTQSKEAIKAKCMLFLQNNSLDSLFGLSSLTIKKN